MMDHLFFSSFLAPRGGIRSRSSRQVISAVVPRSSTGTDRCGSLAIFRLEREGTDPASRGLVRGRRVTLEAGGRS